MAKKKAKKATKKVAKKTTKKVTKKATKKATKKVAPKKPAKKKMAARLRSADQQRKDKLAIRAIDGVATEIYKTILKGELHEEHLRHVAQIHRRRLAGDEALDRSRRRHGARQQ